MKWLIIMGVILTPLGLDIGLSSNADADSLSDNGLGRGEYLSDSETLQDRVLYPGWEQKYRSTVEHPRPADTDLFRTYPGTPERTCEIFDCGKQYYELRRNLNTRF